MPDYSLFGDEHVRQYEATNGQTGYKWNDTQILILRTKGRKSGELRKAPLIFGRDGGDFLIVASKGGAPEDPGWYKNIESTPDIEIQVKGDVIPVHARTASAEEKSKQSIDGVQCRRPAKKLSRVCACTRARVGGVRATVSG